MQCGIKERDNDDARKERRNKKESVSLKAHLPSYFLYFFVSMTDLTIRASLFFFLQPRPQPENSNLFHSNNKQGIEGVDYHLGSVDDLDPSEWHVPPHCIPVHANVTTYDWSRLINAFGAANDNATAAAAAATAGASSSSPQAEADGANPGDNGGIGNGFDAIMMDPPWQLATANPTRGVALGYSQLTDADIENLPIPAMQPKSGYLFVWVINAKYKFCLDLFDKWGYE